MRADGIERAIGIVMAPHWSGMSVETYIERVIQATRDDGGGPAFTFVRSYHDHPAFIAFLTARVAEALSRLTDGGARERRGDLLRALAAGADARRRHAALQDVRLRRVLPVSGRAPGDRRPGGRASSAWTTTSSRGRAPAEPTDPWWGPPIEEVIEELAIAGRDAVVVCSAGFVADHLEILYDLDIEARGIAERAGTRFERTQMPNADPGVPRRARGRSCASIWRRCRRDDACPRRVDVVGGGISGLTTAYRLAAAGGRRHRARGGRPARRQARDDAGG